MASFNILIISWFPCDGKIQRPNASHRLYYQRWCNDVIAVSQTVSYNSLFVFLRLLQTHIREIRRIVLIISKSVFVIFLNFDLCPILFSFKQVFSNAYQVSTEGVSYSVLLPSTDAPHDSTPTSHHHPHLYWQSDSSRGLNSSTCLHQPHSHPTWFDSPLSSTPIFTCQDRVNHRENLKACSSPNCDSFTDLFRWNITNGCIGLYSTADRKLCMWVVKPLVIV